NVFVLPFAWYERMLQTEGKPSAKGGFSDAASIFQPVAQRRSLQGPAGLVGKRHRQHHRIAGRHQAQEPRGEYRPRGHRVMHVARLYGAAIEFDEEPGRRSSCLTLI